MPRTAVTGPVVLVSVDGAESAPSAVPLTIDATAPPVTSGAGDSLGIDVEVQGNRVFYGAERQAQVSYLVRGSQAANVAVELIRLSDGVAITRWEPGLVAPETPQTVTWDGTAGGKVQRDGRYAFRVFAQSASGATASSQVPAASRRASPRAPSSSSATSSRSAAPTPWAPARRAFGGGRGHQGQDTFAKCGTPLVAARGGVVKFKQYHSRAGHYIVIDGDDEGYDYAYMHLRDAVARRPGRPRLHRPADRLRRRHRPRHRLPPALRDLEGPGLVQRRVSGRPAAVAAGLGQDFVASSAVRRPRLSAANVNGGWVGVSSAGCASGRLSSQPPVELIRTQVSTPGSRAAAAPRTLSSLRS